MKSNSSEILPINCSLSVILLKLKLTKLKLDIFQSVSSAKKEKYEHN